jgi:glucose-1-phosphate thymidylyltransferase
MAPRGILLAGGKGTRLGDLTRATNKHLLPVGAQPMILYPLRKLVAAGVTEIALVTGREHVPDFVELLGDGRDHRCTLTYRAQEEPGGVAQALGLAEEFASGQRTVVLLGDNIFEAPLGPILQRTDHRPDHAWVVLKRVPDPRRYGVAEMRGDALVGIEEKPAVPASDLAVVGIYVYPPDVFEAIREVRPSVRGEREITDVNTRYLRDGRLSWVMLDGYWTDAGTAESLAYSRELIAAKPPSW